MCRINPRGKHLSDLSYYLDNETGLCYLNSRYYDPTVGRFLSPDSLDYLDPESIGGLNLYAYCGNNPVNYYDPSGCEVITAFFTGLLLSLAILFLAAGALMLFYPQYSDSFAQLGNMIATGIDSIEEWFTELFGKVETPLQIAETNSLFVSLASADRITVWFAEHRKNKRPSSRNKHEEGAAALQRGQWGEKGDKRRKRFRKMKSIILANPFRDKY